MSDPILENLRDYLRDYQDLKEKLGQKTREASKYKDGYNTLIAFIIIGLIFFTIAKFEGFEIVVTPDSGSVIAISSSWWGLKTTEREIKWMRTDQYDSPGWMTKGKDGSWYLYLIEDDRPW